MNWKSCLPGTLAIALLAVMSLNAEDAAPVEVRVRRSATGPKLMVDGMVVCPRFYFGSPATLCNMAWTWETQFNYPFRAKEDTNHGRVELPLYDGEKPIDFYDADLVDRTAGTTNFLGGRVRTDRYMRDDLKLKAGHRYDFRVKVKADHDRTYFHYLGQELPYGDTLGDTVKLAAEAGVNLVTFSTDNSWGCDEWWNEAGDETGFRRIDELCERLIAVNPKVLLMPRIIGNAPDWYLAKHPEARMKFDREFQVNMVSLSYRPYRRAVCEMIEKLARHLQRRFPRNFAGLHTGGQNSAEWFYFNSLSNDLSGYDAATRDAFREYLAEKGEPDAATAEVPAPEERRRIRPGSRFDPEQDRRTLDFIRFRQLEVASLLRDIGRAIRRGTDGRSLAVFFYGYTWELCSNDKGCGETGHYALEWLMEHGADAVDGFSGPLSYNDRNLTGSASVMSAAETMTRRGFLWINEDDTRTCREEFWDNHSSLFHRHDDPWITRQIYLRDSASAILRGYGDWWMDLFGRGWQRDRSMWDARRDLNALDRALLERRSPYSPEVASVMDEATLITAAKGSPEWIRKYRRRSNFVRSGVTYGQYLFEDFVRDPPPVKLVYLQVCDLKGERLARWNSCIAAHPGMKAVVNASADELASAAIAEAAARAGAHVYTAPEKAYIEAAEGYVMVQAREEGPLAIDFGCPGAVIDVLTGKSVGEGPRLTLPFRRGEVRLFRMLPLR